MGYFITTDHKLTTEYFDIVKGFARNWYSLAYGFTYSLICKNDECSFLEKI